MKKKVKAYLSGKGYAVSPSAHRDGEEDKPADVERFITGILGLDTEADRRAFWREAYTTGHSNGRVPRTLDTLFHEVMSRHGDQWSEILLALAVLLGAAYPFWLLARLTAKKISRLRRGTYYERERARRWHLADERVAIRVRRTMNPCPSLNEVRNAWHRVHATRGHEHVLAILHCGGLLEDLEGYVDNHAYVTRGVSGIRGRAPGIKGLFRNRAPDLFADYKNVMRCKALAKKYRQAVGCPDPVPTSAILPVPISVPLSVDRSHAAAPPPSIPSVPSDFAAERSGVQSEPSANPWTGGMIESGGVTFPLLPWLRDVNALSEWMAKHGNTAYLRTQKWLRRPDAIYTEANLLPDDARTEAARILTFGDGTLVAVEAAIALRIDPACVQPESGARVVRTMGGRRVAATPRRVRDWLAGASGLRARGVTAA